MFSILLFYLTIPSVSCYSGYAEVTEENVPAKVSDWVSVQRDTV